MSVAQNRCRRAREHAGLSVTQAAKQIGIDRDDLLRIEIFDSSFWDADTHKIADVYRVNPAWLSGEAELRDYAAVDAIPGARDTLTFHDRNVIAEFMAARQRLPTKEQP